MPTDTEKTPAWTPTEVLFLYRHQNRCYYVRTFATRKEKWTRLKAKLLSVAKNRMGKHLGTAERHKSSAENVLALAKLTFGEVTQSYPKRRLASEVRPDTKA